MQLESRKREYGRRIKESEQIGEHRAVRTADEVLRDSNLQQKQSTSLLSDWSSGNKKFRAASGTISASFYRLIREYTMNSKLSITIPGTKQYRSEE